MRENRIRAKAKRKFRVTTDSKHNLPVAPNLLQRNFCPENPNQVWASDITYVWTKEGWLFLAVIVDLFSRQIVGWSIDKTMTRELVLSALRQAYFRQTRNRYRMLQNHSRKGDCWDNAVVESFFHTLKTEAIFDRC